jgi:methylase of polypeptide subunit release factors
MATTIAPIRLDSARRTAALRAWLAASGYDAPGLRTLLGTTSTSLVDSVVAPAARRRLTVADTPSAVLARMFLLGDEVSAGDAARRLGPLADELIALGLVTASGSTLQPAVRLVPHDHLLIASDLPEAGGADHVAAVHRPSALLAGLTVRRHVRRALDIGTGNGVQALLVAAHADRVIATDINERALEFAEFNCALNGVENVELRHGSLLDPVLGERFGLVVANPPYVISPGLDIVFRDSGMERDAVSETVVRGVPDLLEVDGFATVLISWDATHGDLVGRPTSWVDALPADTWILHTATQDPFDAAARWTADASDRETAIDRWLAEYGRLGIEWIAYGAVIMRGRADEATFVRSTGVPDGIPQAAGVQIERMFAAPNRELRNEDRLMMAPGAELVGSERPGPGGWRVAGYELRLRDGLRFAADLDPDAVTIIRALDGRSTLGDLGLGVDERRLVRRLTELGFAEVV